MSKLLKNISDYYTDKLRIHGATPKGVDWNTVEQQQLRFAKLLQVTEEGNKGSLLDYGCGYGATYPYVLEKYPSLQFSGFDISEPMIAKALEIHGSDKCDWFHKIEAGRSWDYTIASGIFNVKMEHDSQEWEQYILDTLAHIDSISSKGFAVNMLTSYSDAEYQRNDLYYASPAFFFDHCKRHFSRFVTLLHDYPLYEFTIVVRKDL